MYSFAALLLALAVSEATPPDLVITNVTVIAVETGERLPDQTVVIDGGLIVSVFESVPQIDLETHLVDAEGRFLVPGLWDTHVHSVTNWAWHAPVFLANGITSVRNMHTSEPDGCELIDAIKEQGERVETPRMIANGFIVGGSEEPWGGVIPVLNAGAAEQAIFAHIHNNMDFIKVYEGIPHDAYRALMASAADAGLAVDGHLPSSLRTQLAIELGQRTIEHGIDFALGCIESDEAEQRAASLPRRDVEGPPGPIELAIMTRAYDEARVDEQCVALVELMAENGTVAVPTIVYTFASIPR